MITIKKSCLMLIVAITATLFGGHGSAHAGTIYNVKSYDNLQNGYSLSGTITTDGKIGNLTAANILGYSFTASGSGGTFTINGTQNLYFAGLYATSTQIILDRRPFPSYSHLVIDDNSNGNQIVYLNSQQNYGVYQYFFYASPNRKWDVNNTTGLALPTLNEDWIIAETSSPSAVPEPASLTMLGLGALGLFGYRLRRRKHAVAAAA